MRLLFTRFGASGLNKHDLISLIDTDTGEQPFIDIVGHLDQSELYSGAGIVYSGNWVCIGVNSLEESKSYLLLFNFLNETIKLIELPLSYYISDIVSVFPGQLYLCSEGTNSINNVSFSPDTGKFWSDQIHYKLPSYQICFSSLCSNQMRWYGTILGAVLEFTNNRVLHSGLVAPHSIFFNSSGRICFSDSNKFYCGDDIFYFNSDVVSVYEDTVNAGYWIYTMRDKKLYFQNYNGNNKHSIQIEGPPIFKIVEVRGGLNDAF